MTEYGGWDLSLEEEDGMICQSMRYFRTFVSSRMIEFVPRVCKLMRGINNHN